MEGPIFLRPRAGPFLPTMDQALEPRTSNLRTVNLFPLLRLEGPPDNRLETPLSLVLLPEVLPDRPRVTLLLPRLS